MLLCCTLSDEELHTRNELIEKSIIKLGDNGIGSIDELYSMIKTDVYAYALSKVGNPKDAEDIMQDTFIQIYKYSKRYEPKGKPLAWIFTIVNNLANRKFQIEGRFSSYDEVIEESEDEKNYEENIINNEFLKYLFKVLNKEEQEIVVLHVVSGMKNVEIAKFLDKPISTVLSKYNRAIKKLKKYAEREEE